MIKYIIRSLIGLIAVSVIVVYWLGYGFSNVVIRDGLYLSTVFLAVIGGLFALKNYGLKNARSVTLLCLTGVMVGLLGGELVFEYHYIILKNDIPFPSVGDIFYLSSYPLFIMALSNEVKLANVNWGKINKVLLGLLIVVSLIIAYIVLRWGIIAGYDPNEKLFTNIVAMSYGIGDLLLIMFTAFLLILIREYRGGRFARVWLLLMGGLAFSLLVDVLREFFLKEYHNEVWFWKSFFDSASMVTYLFYAEALFEFAFSILDVLKKASTLAPAKAGNNDTTEVH